MEDRAAVITCLLSDNTAGTSAFFFSRLVVIFKNIYEILYEISHLLEAIIIYCCNRSGDGGCSTD